MIANKMATVVDGYCLYVIICTSKLEKNLCPFNFPKYGSHVGMHS